MSLATIAIIAGGAALFQWGRSALSSADGAEELVKKMEGLRERTADLNEELRALRAGVSSDELILLDAIKDKRDELAAQESYTARVLGALNKRRSQRDAAAIQLQLTALEDELAARRASLAEQENIIQATRDAAAEEVRLTQEIEAAAKAAATLAENMRLAKVEANLAAQEFVRANAFSSRFAGEEAVMSQAVGVAGPGTTLLRSSGQSGSGGADPRVGQIDSLVNSLQTEREVIDEWYAESLTLLQSASDAELMAIGGKHAAMQRLEKEHQDRMSGLTEGGMSGALGIYQQYGSQILGAMGATGKQMALINAAIGASQALADPTIPFWGKFAAVAQVLAAGRSLADQASTGSAAGGAASVAQSSQSITRTVDVNLSGGSESSQGSIRGLIAQINDAIGDGATLNVRGMA